MDTDPLDTSAADADADADADTAAGSRSGAGAEAVPVAFPTFLAGGGEMGARMRTYDWAASPLGPPEGWPQSLKTVVRLMLDSRYAMWMLWGPDVTFFCNDAYLPTVGLKRDWVLGARADHVWAEIWPVIGPRIERVLATGVATWDEGLQLFLERSGYPEETYHTFSYSPLQDDAGRVAGMLCVVTEETDRLISERRLRLLRDLAAQSTGVAGVDAACERLAATLSKRRLDVPFMLLYGADAAASQLLLRAWSGDVPASARPAVIELPLAPAAAAPGPVAAVGAAEEGPVDATPVAAPTGPFRQALAEALRGGRPVVLDELPDTLGEIACGSWPEPVRRALVLPLRGSGVQGGGAAVLVAGVSTRRALDAAYRDFLGLVAAQIAAVLADARAFEDARRRAEALAEVDRAKTAFFSNVSHEFRTPLTLLIGPLEETLHREDAQLSALAREALTLAHRNSVRLLRLVNMLLDFSRIEAGRLQARFRPTDLAALTADLASVFRSAMARAGLVFVIDCPPLPEPVYVDPELWEKVVLNLLSNALKYTFDGEVRLKLQVVDRVVRLTVTDTGTGIGADALPHVFERFYRVPHARGRTHEGTGIGLALVQELAQMHGGSIQVHSVVDRGSRFTVDIPRGHAHLPADRIEAASVFNPGSVESYLQEAMRWLPTYDGPDPGPDRAGDATAPARASEGRVLLVDDNADMRAYVRRILSGRFDVTTATDGRQALERIARDLPDLVLADVMMPRLDGFGLLQALRASDRTRDLPVILLSARAGEESQIEGIEAGADDYLVKPFSARELVARVTSNLALASARRASTRAVRESHSHRTFLLALADELRNGLAAERIVATAALRIGQYLNADAAGYGEMTGETNSGLKAEWRGPAASAAAEPLPPAVGGTVLHWQAPGLAAGVSVPCLAEGRHAATLWVASAAPRDWTEAELLLLEDAASRVWSEVARARAELAMRESEARFRTMADSSPLMVWVIDPAGRVDFVNRAFLDFFGLQSASGAQRRWQAALHPDDAPAYRQAVEDALARRSRLEVRARMRHADGSWHWVQTYGAPRFSTDGAFLGLVGTSPDVTEQVEADRRKDEFLATLAHELRNPLAPIRQASAVARKPDTAEAQRRWAHEVIERQVQHMALLLDDLLDIARITRGKLRLRREPILLKSVVDNAVETARPLIESRRHRLTLDLPDEPVWLDADPVRVAQVFSNLLGNAAKYTEPQGELHLSARCEHGELVARVSDNGIGIDPQMLPRLFEMFSQVGAAIDRAEGGLGIGLALVRGLVELHGGRIEAHSDGLGHGATFTVRMAVCAAPSAARPVKAPAEPAGPASLRVLVADDNRDAADSLTMLLEMQGHEVRTAYTGLDAVATAAAFSPQVALLDIGMADLNGHEVARRLRASAGGSTMLLVAVTGWGQEDDRRRAFEAGFDHHMAKPLDPDGLLRLLGAMGD